MPDPKENNLPESEAQTSSPTKKKLDDDKNGPFEPPINTPATDSIKNSAGHTPGLNEQDTRNNNTLPLD